MIPRDRFVRACRSLEVDRPPLWMMRQAGRSLPEYRAVKEKHSFVEIVQTPELATEVTLQPIRRFGFDAAILFSDILVISEAMGQPYGFADTGGIKMDFKVASTSDVDRLETGCIRDRLRYVADAIPLIREGLGEKTALIGFAGAPWTLANYMMEGGSAREFDAARTLFYTEPAVFHRLMEKITASVTEYLRMQIEAGVDAVQIFDTQAGVLPLRIFEEASARWIEEIVAGLDGDVPVIVFSKGSLPQNRGALEKTGADVISADWTVDLPALRRSLPENVAVQGNLDPVFLRTNPHVAAEETRRLLESMRGLHGHVFNLGHGVTPASQIDCIEAVAQTVQTFA